jgi:type IV pilus assembly protein PilN
MNDEDKDNIKILDIDKEKQNDENQSVNDSDSSDIKISDTLTENQPDSEFKSEEDKEHEVIHKKEGRLHIYIRQDKYKGELKSKIG